LWRLPHFGLWQDYGMSAPGSRPETENAQDRPRFAGEEARRMTRLARTATLATLLSGGTPYASLVNIATDQRGAPLILISRLAWHTRNLEADGRASLLVVGEGEFADALEGPRVTLIGRFAPLANEAAARRYLARHPAASLYANFKDFGFWRMEIERAHAVAGFGRIETMDASELLIPAEQARRLAALEEGAIAHMNEDHGEAVSLYAPRLLNAPPGDWRMTACDADGIDLGNGETALRLAFDRPVQDSNELRAKLVELAKQARSL
jgi:putative heme iron utilization protein